jgi:hypothetical protein
MMLDATESARLEPVHRTHRDPLSIAHAALLSKRRHVSTYIDAQNAVGMVIQCTRGLNDEQLYARVVHTPYPRKFFPNRYVCTTQPSVGQECTVATKI